MEALAADVRRSEEGSTVPESVFAILFLMTLVLGTVQIVLTLYARNVVRTAAHEGVRSAVERDASGMAAEIAARNAVERAAGGLLGEVEVDVTGSSADPSGLITVRIQGKLRALGPLPFDMPMTATAHGVAARDPR